VTILLGTRKGVPSITLFAVTGGHGFFFFHGWLKGHVHRNVSNFGDGMHLLTNVNSTRFGLNVPAPMCT